MKNAVLGRPVVPIALAVLGYLLVASSFQVIESVEPLLVLSVAAALVGGCAFLLDQARKAQDEKARRRARIRAAGIPLLLLPLFLYGNKDVVLAGILICFFMLVWRWSRLLAGVPLFLLLLTKQPYFYFGTVLIALGLALQSRRLSDYVRDLFPRPVRSAR